MSLLGPRPRARRACGSGTAVMAVLLGILRVPPNEDEVRAVRRWLYGLLGESHGAMVEDAVVGASELVTNSIKHSDTRARGGEISITALSIDGKRLRIEVADDGSSRNKPALRKIDTDAQGGRGLLIIKAISAGRWGAETDDAGQMVWFEMPTPSAFTAGRHDTREETSSLEAQQ